MKRPACSAPSQRGVLQVPHVCRDWRLAGVRPHPTSPRRRRRRWEGDKGMGGQANGNRGGGRILCNCQDAAFGELAAAGNFGSPTLRPRRVLHLLQSAFFYLFLAPDLSNQQVLHLQQYLASNRFVYLPHCASIHLSSSTEQEKSSNLSPVAILFFLRKNCGVFTCACNY